MTKAIRGLRSALYLAVIYPLMAIYGIVFLPWALLSPKGARFACRAWARTAMALARPMIGLRCEVRGTPPKGEVLIAAKHQSFLDILMIYAALERPRFIMKRELLYTPVIGQYAWRLGCIPVDRGRRAQAVKKMVDDVEAGRREPGQLVIYPQGTRIAPGARAPYKVGAAVLYQAMNARCVPVACNVGLFWPRKGILRHPGTAVVEFLPEIEAGLPVAEFTQRVQDVIEARSDALMAEAGFVPRGVPHEDD
ncbi:lysophospholipid acyltransferase family protein [Pseudoroseicyclus aestuarii]|uniref:1-acyl-sn-glycerol-3-phosphate acyltransferase n=1 Tax=Pseudoroseicyclus aestuarii TaxID=1795041 RepID=A0A318SXU9_9RHOB|nr:lysophospholipid acyltransferase family protein [Pseudoroseicyclus aestuarii]PYE84667.1 1-acyl-sn-glycerol-3-phosphate acyltransferase [Pseudoroseicyclus aestuarii]